MSSVVTLVWIQFKARWHIWVDFSSDAEIGVRPQPPSGLRVLIIIKLMFAGKSKDWRKRNAEKQVIVNSNDQFCDDSMGNVVSEY